MLLAALPAAAGFVKNIGGFVSSASSFINPGAARDADRLKRAQWMRDAALHGSVLAAQIIYAGVDNVGSNEDPYWIEAADAVRTSAPAVWQAATTRGKFWPVGAPFDMPNERSRIAAELEAANIAPPSGTIPDGTGNSSPLGQVMQPVYASVGDAVQQIGSAATTSLAGAVNPKGNYATLPTSTTTLLLIGAAVVVGLILWKK